MVLQKTSRRAIRQTNGPRGNHASAAAVTATAVTAANAVMVLNAAKIVLKPLFLLKIQDQMRLQTNKYMCNQLLNL